MLRIPLRGLICLDQAESTHMLLKSQEYADLEPYTMVMARRQTKGRGQRGNSWESEDGKNLTFSMKARPDWLHPSRQFAISEATSIAIVTLLKEYGIAASVKWPNDIYVGHRKICGILIDHSLQGMEITGSVISAGLNVNQIRFLSDAPNPVSMLQLLPPGSPEIPIEKIARRAGELICGMLEETVQPENRMLLHRTFMAYLYRNDGRPHLWHDNRTDTDIIASIEDVATDGTLLLHLSNGERRRYLFKEVTYTLPTPTGH